MYTRLQAYQLTKAQYNNLIVVMRQKLLCRRFADMDEYALISTSEDYADAMRRCAHI